MRCVTVIGARPQFIKAAPVGRALASVGIEEILVHTGQHYDSGMSDVFFSELEIKPPTHHLGIGGGSHGAMTGRMLEAIEAVLVAENPDILLVYGDTNSTLAGALAAAKLHIPVAHVEAGLRSFNRAMPEEVNRVLTDHVSRWLLCPGEVAICNLLREGITEGVLDVGDVMADAIKWASARAGTKGFPRCLPGGISRNTFGLLTIHRQENTEQRERLRTILAGIEQSGHTMVFPVHPRTSKALKLLDLKLPANVHPISPVSYLEMVALLDFCDVVATDSGGIQKEAYWMQRPCVTLRQETEWSETLEHGWNRIVGADASLIADALAKPVKPSLHPPLYGDGNAAAKVAEALVCGRIS
jgi:UDP-GlcNAc3NAcA epimerase